MLTPAQTELWTAYLLAEARATRDHKLQALNAFLDSLAGTPPEELFSWAIGLAERVVDQKDSPVIRRPLLERVLLPALLQGYKSRTPGCARWLAGLSRGFLWNQTYREQLPDGEQSEVGLLRAALRHDPADHRARTRLLQLLAARLNYTLHELPTGVLYGIDGATPEQCEELQQELKEFCELAAADGESQRYAELIEDCRFHCKTYRDYLLSTSRGIGYAEYLRRQGQIDEK